MLDHGNDAPAAPARVVVMGATGFVGNAIAARLEQDRVPVLRLTRREVDLLVADGAERLAAQLRPADILVAAAALAPCRSAAMLRDNTIIAAAMLKAATAVPLAQVVNISSDAIYADSASPLTEASPKAPESLHGTMHLAREMSPRPVPIEELPRTGPMPHKGSRAFDITSCRAVFRDFAFTPLERGLTKTMEEAQSNKAGVLA